MLRNMDNKLAAIAYIRACLEQGNTLAKHLLDLPLDQGQVIAPLPNAVSETAYSQFTVGGVTTRNVTEPVLANFIATYLQGMAGRYAVFEDALARPGDSILASSQAPFVTFDSEVYYLLSNQQIDPNQIIATIRRATSHLFIGVLTSLNAETELRPRQSITANLLATIAQHTEHILIGAYDSEGVLIWSRS